MMQVIPGIFFHFIGDFAPGSFYVPFKKVKGWAWENYWLVGGFFSWRIIPPLAAWLTIPDFTEIISQTSTSTLGWTYFWGLLWGIGGLTYGLGMRYIGMSVGNSILLGLTSAFGALVPSIYYDSVPTEGKTTVTELMTTSWGRIVLIGTIICLAGIVICGRAGVLKEKELSEEKRQESVKKFNLSKGLIVCIISGILNACFNYGIEAGIPMAESANGLWKATHPEETTEFLYQNNVIYIVILWGGLTLILSGVCFLVCAINRTVIIQIQAQQSHEIFCSQPWRERSGFNNFSSMAWTKANLAIVPAPGYYTWLYHPRC